jgi:hypothetical protein
MSVALELETDLQDAYSHAKMGETFLKDDQKNLLLMQAQKHSMCYLSKQIHQS